MLPKMKKLQTNYKLTNDIQLVVNEEYKQHICLIELGENCSGILKHWGSKKEIIAELKDIINKLEDFI